MKLPFFTPRFSRDCRPLRFCAPAFLASVLALSGQTSTVSQGSYDLAGDLTDVVGSSSAFNSSIQSAWADDAGGSIVDLSPSGSNGASTFFTEFGTNGAFRLNYSTDVAMQAATNTGSFRPLTGGQRTTLQQADSTGWTLTFNSIADASTLVVNPTLGIGSVGFTLLPRGHATYPLDVRATVTLSDNSTLSNTQALGDSNAYGKGYFFTYSARSGTTISSITFETFETGTMTAVSTRLAMDQMGYTVIPETGTYALIIGFGALLFVGQRRYRS